METTINHLLGRAEPRVGENGRRFFGTLSSTGQPGALVTELDEIETWKDRLDSCRERLFLVSSRAIEVKRFSQIPLSPLRVADILGPPSQQASGFKVRINTDGVRGPSSVLIDANATLQLYARDLSVDLLGPLGTVEVGVPGQSPTAQGLVFDALVGIDILAIEAPLGPNVAPLSQTVVAPAAEIPAPPTVVMKPNFARRVQIYTTSAGPYPPSMRWFLGDPRTFGEAPGAIDLGIVAWETAGQRRPRLEIDVPEHATHLVIDAVPDVDRIFTFRWEIQP